MFLGVPPAHQTIGEPVLERDGDDYVLTLQYRGGSQVVRFAADTLQMTRVEERPEGAAPLQGTFADYRDGFARALDLVGERGVTASIAFDEIEPNAAIDVSAFDPPAAPRVLPLDRAAAAS